MAAREIIRMTAGQERFGKFMIRYLCRLQIVIYRLSGGRVWNTFLGGKVGLLGVVGCRSGTMRTVPVVFAEDSAGRIVLAASQGGMSTHPAWYFNLRNSETATFQIGAKRRHMAVHMAGEDEEKPLWELLQQAYPDFADYRERAALAHRRIAVFVLTPTSG